MENCVSLLKIFFFPNKTMLNHFKTINSDNNDGYWANKIIALKYDFVFYRIIKILNTGSRKNIIYWQCSSDVLIALK